VALLGTTIAPYLFFWQVREEVEQHLSKVRAEYEARHEDWLISPGIILSQIVTMFIIIAAGATLHGGGASIVTAADAAAALKPIAGPFASYLFAIGIIGTGVMALPVLTASTAYVVAEAASWRKQSLSDTFSDAKPFYTVIALSLLSGVLFTIYKVDPIKALYYSQVAAGVLVPFILVLILYLSNKKSIMGQFRSGWFDNFFGTLAALLMFAAIGFLVVGLF
jgi:Mn2+/Fe2+ NRAMP family transporter